MVVSTKRHFRLEPNEYIVTVESADATDYRIYYKGKDVTNTVTAVIRTKLEA